MQEPLTILKKGKSSRERLAEFILTPAKKKAADSKARFRAGFAQIDASGVVHYARVLSYFEQLEEEFFLKRKYGWPQQFQDGICLARRELRCTYHSPIKYGDELSGMMRVSEVGKSHAKYEFSIRNLSTKKIALEGSLIVVAVALPSWKKTDIPVKLRRILERSEDP